MSESSSDAWFARMVEKGHTPAVYVYGDGEPSLDVFVTDSGYHNGPGCTQCGWTVCMHCQTIESIPDCTKPYLDLLAVEVGSMKELTKPK